MAHDISYQLSDVLFRAGVRRSRQLYLGWKVAVPATLYVILVFCLWWIGGPILVVGIFTGMGMLLAVLVFVAFFYAAWQGRKLLEKLPDRSARCVLDEDGVRLENAFGVSNFRWVMLEKVVRAPDVWLVFYGRSQYFVLPGRELEGEAGRELMERVKASGGKVVELR